MLYFTRKKQPFYGQLQRSTCYGQQEQTEEKEKFQEQWKQQQRAKCSDWKKNSRSSLETRKRGKHKNSSSAFRKCRFSMLKVKRASPTWQKA